MRDKHPHLGRLSLVLGGEPRHETSWSRGADGEAYVAESLGKRLNQDVVVLHDRRIPRSHANIDHNAG